MQEHPEPGEQDTAAGWGGSGTRSSTKLMQQSPGLGLWSGTILGSPGWPWGWRWGWGQLDQNKVPVTK
jgi:hypothetical protein